MAEPKMHLQSGIAAWAARARSAASEQTRDVDAVVFAVVPEYHQVKVRDPDGHVYSLTRKTEGIQLSDLHEGQRIVCTVTRRLPRVLRATIA